MPQPPLPVVPPDPQNSGTPNGVQQLKANADDETQQHILAERSLELDALRCRHNAAVSELDVLRERNLVLEKRNADPKDASREGDDPETARPTTEKSSTMSSLDTTAQADNPDWHENYRGKHITIAQLFPPLEWVPRYIRCVKGQSTKADTDTMGALPYSLKGDAIAGLTVGVMLVPQCLAFALLAGMPVQVGLFSSFAPLMAYALFGTIRQVQPGPTALMSLLTGQALDAMNFETDADRIAGAALIALFSGSISFLLGVVRFGFVVDFMSHTVMQGFCSAAGITIATSQLKHLLGIKMPRKKYWWKTVWYLISHLDEIDFPTLCLGGTLLSLLFMLKYWKAAGSIEKREKHILWRVFPKDKDGPMFKVMKIIADLSSILCVVVGWLWGAVYRAAAVDSVKMVGKVDTDGFGFLMPGYGIMDDVDLASVFIAAAVMAIVGFLETIAVGGKFAMAAKYEYDPNQELLALGIANVAGSVMGAYPTTGSFSRTAVNAMLGASSLVSCALSAWVVFLATYVLLPVIQYLPLAALAPIIIVGAIGVVSLKDFKAAFGSSRAEFFVMLATFVISLVLTVKEGLGCGFIFSVLKTLRDLANPNLAVLGLIPNGEFRDVRNFPDARQIPNTVFVRMDARLGFFNARKMKEFCLNALNVRGNFGDQIEFLVIDARPINHVDLTGGEMLESLAESLEGHAQKLIVANLKIPVLSVLAGAGVQKHLEKHNGCLCTDMEHALQIITKEDIRGSRAGRDASEMIERQKTRLEAEHKEAGQGCTLQ